MDSRIDNTHQIYDTHEGVDPRLGIFPDRFEFDDDQNLDTFCAVCGVPVRVIVSKTNGNLEMTSYLIRTTGRGTAYRER